MAREREVGADTLVYSVGSVSLDAGMARTHGWTENEIDDAARKLGAISRHYGQRARRRYPERYEGDVFVGE